MSKPAAPKPLTIESLHERLRILEDHHIDQHEERRRILEIVRAHGLAIDLMLAERLENK